MKKIIWVLFALIMISVVGAALTIIKDAPPNYYYSTNDTVTFNCSVNPTPPKTNLSSYNLTNLTGYIDPINNKTFDINNLTNNVPIIANWNITNISLYTNSSGTFGAVDNLTMVNSVGDSASAGFIVTGLVDHAVINWACYACEINDTSGKNGISNCSLGTNRTLYVEIPPDAKLTHPINGANSSTEINSVNFTIDGLRINNDKAVCSLYTNESGGWGSRKDYITNSSTNSWAFDYQFADDTTTKWGVYCYESLHPLDIYGWSSQNYTITVDTIFPAVTINTPNGIFDTDGTYSINYTATDTNLDECDAYLNLTTPAKILNSTNTSMNTGIPDMLTLTTIGDGNWSYYFDCNDSVNHRKNSSTQWIYVDSATPSFNATADNISYTPSGCDNMLVSFNATRTTEPINATIHWGTANKMTNSSNSDFKTAGKHTFNVSNMNNKDTVSYNFTVCDKSGKCNDTESYTFTFPWKICSGWTLYSIWDSQITMENIGTNSSADYVYWWNSSSQSWKYWSPGVETSSEHILTFGDVVHLYDAIGTTLNRNTSLQQAYVKNIYKGDNWVGLWQSQKMGDLVVDFMNSSNTWSLGYEQASKVNGSAEGGGPIMFNITDFNVFNNSAHEYTIPYVYNSSLNNNTEVGNLTDFEALWLWSDWNLTWIGTDINQTFNP
jgi:hypothetical protein